MDLSLFFLGRAIYANVAVYKKSRIYVSEVSQTRGSICSILKKLPLVSSYGSCPISTAQNRPPIKRKMNVARKRKKGVSPSDYHVMNSIHEKLAHISTAHHQLSIGRNQTTKMLMASNKGLRNM